MRPPRAVYIGHGEGARRRPLSRSATRTGRWRRRTRQRPGTVPSPAELIDGRIEELGDWRIEELGDWRGDLLARIRALVHEAEPDVVEQWKWRGVPTWYRDGILCTGETYKQHVKVTFFKGARLEDPRGVFNAGPDGNARRAIDLHEGDTLDEDGFRGLIRAAAALNAG